MALVLKPLKCPFCHQPIDKRLLKRSGLLKAFLNRTAFPCPHCQQQIRLPEHADTVVSMGLFVAVILAPLFHYWEVNLLDSKILFLLGCAICFAGLWTQRLEKAQE